MKRLALLLPFVVVYFSVFAQITPEEIKAMGQNRHAFKEPVKSELLKDMKNPAAIADYGDAPNVNWFETFGGSGPDSFTAVEHDSAGNIYLAGYFDGRITIGGENIVATGARESVLAKYDPNGNLLWKNHIAAQTDREVIINDLVIDNGNICITGHFSGGIQFGTDSLTNDSSNTSFFLARLNTMGDFISALQHSHFNFESGHKLIADGNSNIYAIAVSSSDPFDIYSSLIIKINQNDAIEWIQEHDERFNDMVLYGDEVYLTGAFNQINDGELNNGITYIPDNTYSNVFIASMDLDGNFQWIEPAEHEFGDSYAAEIDMDDDDNVYVTGYFRYDITLQDSSLVIDLDGSFIAKFDETITLQWMRNVSSDYGLPKISTQNGGGVMVACYDGIYQFDPNGILIFDSIYDNSLFEAITASLSGVSVVGQGSGQLVGRHFQNMPEPEFTISIVGNSGPPSVYDMVRDQAGNLYLFFFSENIDFLGNQYERGTKLAKIDPSGNLIWVKNFTINNLQNIFGQNKLLDLNTSNERLLWCGGFEGSIDFPDGPTISSEGSGAFFVAQYDLDGNFLDVIMEDSCQVGIESLSSDRAGNILISGEYYDTLNIGDTILLSEANTFFQAKYNSSGEYQWVVPVTGSFGGTIYSLYNSTDSLGNVYITGEITTESLTVGDIDTTLYEGDGHVLYAKVNPTGNVEWAKFFGNTDVLGNEYNCWPTSIATTPGGYSYIKGWNGDSVYFDDILLTSPYCPYSFFIGKIDPQGNPVWVNSINKEVWAFDYNKFDFDEEGSIYWSAELVDTLHFGNTYTLNANNGLALAKYTSDGVLAWVKHFPGTPLRFKESIVNVIPYDPNSLFISGFFGSRLHVEENEYDVNVKHGFIGLLGDDVMGFREVYRNSQSTKLQVYPNPASNVVTIANNNGQRMVLELRNAVGQLVDVVETAGPKATVDISKLTQGVYFVYDRNGAQTAAQKLIIQ